LVGSAALVQKAILNLGIFELASRSSSSSKG
jgi:hypothetical protein